jgi:hypothetical protein
MFLFHNNPSVCQRAALPSIIAQPRRFDMRAGVRQGNILSFRAR